MSDESQTTTENDNVTTKDSLTDNETVETNNLENIENTNDDNGDVENNVENVETQGAENENTDKPSENNEQPTDLFDTLKDSDAVDGVINNEATEEEPMEVDEVSNEAEDVSQENQPETETETETHNADTTTNDAQTETTNDVNDGSDVNNENLNETQNETTEMEVDCETPQGEDVCDFVKNPNDSSVMENNVEELNCSNLSDATQKNQTISDDPFDSLLKDNDTSINDTSINNRSTQGDNSIMSTTSSVCNEGFEDQNDTIDESEDHHDADDAPGSDHEDDDRDTSSHHDGSTIEGKLNVDFFNNFSFSYNFQGFSFLSYLKSNNFFTIFSQPLMISKKVKEPMKSYVCCQTKKE